LPQFASASAKTMGKRHRPEAGMSGPAPSAGDTARKTGCHPRSPDDRHRNSDRH